MVEIPIARKGSTAFVMLDAVRALAAFTVLLTHLRGATWVEYSALQTPSPLAYILFAASRLGHEAVMVFFVLSGFLVGGQVLRGLQRASYDVTRYTVDRCTRIFIVLVPACLLTAAAYAFVGLPVEWDRLAASLVGLNGAATSTPSWNPPLWSLAYEIWFYVFAGAAGYLAAGGRFKVLALAAVVAAIAVLVKLGAAYYLLFWGIGALSIFLLDTRRPRLLAAVGVVMILAGVAFYQLGSGSKTDVAGWALDPPLAETLICAGLCAALPLLCSPTPGWLRWVAPAISFASAFSYSLYLTHYPVLMLLSQGPRQVDFSPAAVGAFVLRLAVCLAVALAFYFTFERNTPKVRRIVAGRFNPVRMPA